MTRAEEAGGWGAHGPSHPPAGPLCTMCHQPAWGGQVWMDPGGNPTIACRACLLWIGEKDLGLVCDLCGGSGWRPVPDPTMPGTTIDSRCPCGVRR